MALAQWIAVAVALQRFGEIALSRRNEARLRAQGGYEVGATHYPFIVLLHAGWLSALFLAVPRDAPVYWTLLGVFIVLQGLRAWTIVSLAGYWTTRIITVPAAPLSRRGPYRWMRHPNYMVVAAEIAVLPLAFGAWEVSLAFSVANSALLAWRISIENRALKARHGASNSH